MSPGARSTPTPLTLWSPRRRRSGTGAPHHRRHIPDIGDETVRLCRDGLKVTLVAGTTCRFDLEVWPTHQFQSWHFGFLRDIYDSDGNSVGDLFDRGSRANSTVFYTAAADGTTNHIGLGANQQRYPRPCS